MNVKLRTCTAVLIAFFCSIFFIGCRGGEIDKNTNVILIVVDSLRADQLSFYGYQKSTTPSIDNFVCDSILFRNTIASAPWTSPSIGNILTSQYPGVLGYLDKTIKLDDKFITLPEIFKLNGYLTKGIISHVLIASNLLFSQGFDSYDEDNALGHEHISSHSITDKALSFLKENKDKKFFLFLHYFDPHYDYIMHEKYNYFPNYNGPLYSGQSIQEMRSVSKDLNEVDIKYLNAMYDSEISFTDEHIGRLFAGMKDMGLYDKALIIFTADHGEELAEKSDKFIGHQKKLSQAVLHVPLIIKLPNKKEEKVMDDYVGLIDILPTIIKYLNLKIPANFDYDGEIIDLEQLKRINNNPIFSETYRVLRLQSVITEGWKLIEAKSGAVKELYDLDSDPMEMKNLKKENPNIALKLKRILEKWVDYIAGKIKEFNLKKQNPDFTKEQIERLKSLGYIK